MRTIVLTVMLFVASEGLCQTPVKEPDTLQSLLAEVHQLRVDIEAMTVASQRVQIALYVLQMQDAAVARAVQRADNTRNKCQGAEIARQHVTFEIKKLESSLAAGTATKSEGGNKKAEVIALMKRPDGVTLAEIMATTGWQKHTVRGFVSIRAKKGGTAIESFKNAAGERAYRIAQ